MAKSQSRPFVILRHQRHGEVHWDLGLDLGETLATWQLLADPETATGPIEARRIADHRRAYLEYEGEISGNRGSVTRVERGSWTPMAIVDGRWEFELEGEWLRGMFMLSTDDLAVNHWQFQRG